MPKWANMGMTSDNLLECRVMSNTIHMQEIGVVTVIKINVQVSQKDKTRIYGYIIIL